MQEATNDTHHRLTPQEEAWLPDRAAECGLPPAEIVKQLVDERRLKPTEISPQPGPEVHALGTDNAATIALLDSWLLEDATDDPEELRKAEEDLREFKRNMNAPRKENGGRLLFPEVELAYSQARQ